MQLLDPSPAGLDSAAAASGMAPKDYAHALRHAAKAAKIKIPKAETPERVASIVATAYLALPEANDSQILAAADAHNIAVPAHISAAGLAEAARNAGVNTKFFAHQLATAAASQGFKLPASLTEKLLAQGSAAAGPGPEPEPELEPEMQSQKQEMQSSRAPPARGTKARSASRARLLAAGAGVDLADVQVRVADWDPVAKAIKMDLGAAGASEEALRALTAAHCETIAAKDELIRSQAALIAALQRQAAAADDDKRLIATQAALIKSLRKQVGETAAPSAAVEPA